MRATVIIPTHGHRTTMKRTLRALLETEPAKLDVEVIIVDNNTELSLSDDLRALCAAVGDPVRYAMEHSPGATAARHRGAKEARGEILIFIDDDVEVSVGWLGAILGAFSDSAVGIVGGPSIPVFEDSIPAWLWEFLEPNPFGGWWCGPLSLLDLGAPIDHIDPIWIWTLNFGIRREHLQRLGGFHPDLVPNPFQRWQGDGETGLAYKAQAFRLRSVYVPDAMVFHRIEPSRLTPEYFAKRARFQGICDSYTRIRAGTQPTASAQGPRPMPQQGNGPTAWSRVAYEVKLRATKAYNEGWQFHQREVANDPMLLEWVRRESYWDTDIRDELRKQEMSRNFVR